MSFDAPLALLGLVAAALPLLAHLVRRRHLPVIPFAPVRLLLRAAEQNQRRSRLTDLLLLVLRTLLVALVALAAAGPRAGCGAAVDPDGRAESLVIVLDDSLSMRRAPGGRSLFAEARARALRELGGLGPGAQAALVLARRPVSVAVPLTDDVTRVERALRRAEPTWRATDLARAVTAASAELSAARFEERRILVVTDAARHGAPSGLPEPEGIVVDVRDVAARSVRANRAVVEVEVASDPTRGEGALTVAVRVRAFGGAGGPARVELVRGGTTLDRAPIDLSSGGAQVSLHASAGAGADARALVRLVPGDALPDDDERPVLLRRRAAPRVLLVNGDPRPGSPADELHYARSALAVAPPERPVPELRALDADALSAADVEQADLVVLANVPALGASMVDALGRFVERGGGVLVTGGSRVAPNAYGARMSSLLPVGVRGVRDLGGDGATGLLVRPGHPLLASLAGEEPGLARVRVRRALDLATPAAVADVALALPDGAPVLVTARRGDGRLALLGVPLDADWSDLPFRPGFLPLLHLLVGYLAPAASESHDAPVAPGAPVALAVPPGATRLEVRGPDDVAISVEPGRDGRATFRATERPGAYLVRLEGASGATREDPRAAFVVATDPDESDPAPLPVATEAGRRAGRARATHAGELPLAPWLLVLAFGLAFAEGVLRVRGRVALRRRAGAG